MRIFQPTMKSDKQMDCLDRPARNHRQRLTADSTYKTRKGLDLKQKATTDPATTATCHPISSDETLTDLEEAVDRHDCSKKAASLPTQPLYQDRSL